MNTQSTNSYRCIGERTGVQVFERGEAASLDVLAMAWIDAPPEWLHTELLQSDPRLIARLAERWAAGALPDTCEFSLHAQWSPHHPIGMSFHVGRLRGDITRVRNWVCEIEGMWRLDPIDYGAATQARFHARIRFAGRVPRELLRAGALLDLPILFESLRSVVVDKRSVAHDRLLY
jgi:hypothetical protein